jgi:hypothetical protein
LVRRVQGPHLGALSLTIMGFKVPELGIDRQIQLLGPSAVAFGNEHIRK